MLLRFWRTTVFFYLYAIKIYPPNFIQQYVKRQYGNQKIRIIQLHLGEL